MVCSFLLQFWITFWGVSCMTVGRKLLASFQKFIQRLLFTCSLVKSGMQWHEMSTENAPTENAGSSPLFFHQNESLLIKRSGGVLFTATDRIKCPSHQFLNLHAHVQKDNGLRARYPFRRTQLAMLVFLCGLNRGNLMICIWKGRRQQRFCSHGQLSPLGMCGINLNLLWLRRMGVND